MLIFWFLQVIAGIVLLSVVIGTVIIYASTESVRGHLTIRDPRALKIGLVFVLGPIAIALVLVALAAWTVVQALLGP